MNKRYNILIAGGDMRQIYCAEKLSGDHDTSFIGFDDEYIPEGIVSGRAPADAVHVYDCAVLPVIPFDENGMLNTPCSADRLSCGDIRRMVKEDGIILAGKADEALRERFPFAEIYDYLSREELSLKNAVSTAEGAVQIALEELPVTLNGLRVLIVGMGRIGTALSGILRGFGAEVAAAVRNERGVAKARIAGVRPVYTGDITGDCELVFNTVPGMIFDKSMLGRFSRNTLFIDLASKPGGIDLAAAGEMGIRVIWALGLPGKTAPVTSGEIIAETVADILAERGERS